VLYTPKNNLVARYNLFTLPFPFPSEEKPLPFDLPLPQIEQFVVTTSDGTNGIGEINNCRRWVELSQSHTLQIIFLSIIFFIFEDYLLGKEGSWTSSHQHRMPCIKSWTSSHQHRMPCINVVSVLVIKVTKSGINAWRPTQNNRIQKREGGKIWIQMYQLQRASLDHLQPIKHALTTLVKCGVSCPIITRVIAGAEKQTYHARSSVNAVVTA